MTNQGQFTQVTVIAGAFYKTLDAMRSEIDSESEFAKNLTLPYVLMCAATLECDLNHYIVDAVERRWGLRCEDLAKSLQLLKFREKLKNIVLLLTNARYRINQDHSVYQSLAELITVRNNIVHAKDLEKTFTIDEIDESSSRAMLHFENMGGPPDWIFNIRDQGRTYHDALIQLSSLFFDVYRDKDFKENELILRN